MEGVAVNVAVVLGDAPVDNVPVTLGVPVGVPEYVYPDVKEPVALALALALVLVDGLTGVAAEDGVADPETMVAAGVPVAEVIAPEGVEVIVASEDGVALIVGTGGGTVPAAEGSTDLVLVPVALIVGVLVPVIVGTADWLFVPVGVPVIVGAREVVATTVTIAVGS